MPKPTTPADANDRSAASRRALLRTGLGLASAGLILPRCAGAGPVPSGAVPAAAGAGGAANPALEALALQDLLNGGAAPAPIPWLDKNGSHNQMPGPNSEPSNIFHFKGRVARANDFTGTGASSDGEAISFGAKSTDFSFLQGEYFAGRQARQGTFGHL